MSRWLKAVGDSVDEGEALVEVTTDKVDVEVPAPATGELTEIVAAEGETVSVGAVLGRIAPGAAKAAAPAAPPGVSANGADAKPGTPSKPAEQVPAEPAEKRVGAQPEPPTAPQAATPSADAEPPTPSRQHRRPPFSTNRRPRSRRSRPTVQTSTQRRWPGEPPPRTASTSMRCAVPVRAARHQGRRPQREEWRHSHRLDGPRRRGRDRRADTRPGRGTRRLHGAQPRHPHRDVVSNHRGGDPRRPAASDQQRTGSRGHADQGLVHASDRLRSRSGCSGEPCHDRAFRTHRRRQTHACSRTGTPGTGRRQRPKGRLTLARRSGDSRRRAASVQRVSRGVRAPHRARADELTQRRRAPGRHARPSPIRAASALSRRFRG